MSEEFKALCPLYKKCGGCQLQNLDYESQLNLKEGTVIRLLGGFGHVEHIIGMAKPCHYRNKVHAVFGRDSKGHIISGVYQSGTHRIVPVDDCLIEDEISDKIIVSIRKLLRSFKLTVYDETTERGFLRHVLVRRGFTSGEVMVVIVSGSPIFPAKRNFTEALLKLHPEITTVIHNVNPFRTNLLLGNREEVLYGKGYIVDTLCGKQFRISSKSFYQINPVQTETLYSLAVDFAGLTGKETVLDAYCGIGTIGLIASDKAKLVMGVESNKDAVRDAIANAKLNGVKNIKFLCADAGDFLVAAAEEGNKVDVVLMDPPRAGSSEAFLDSVVKMSPRKIVYISCNPETQQRDLRHLVSNGYKVNKIQPVDMFPFTKHVETVCLLSRNS